MRISLLLLALCCSFLAKAGNEDSLELVKAQRRLIDSIDATLHYRTGVVNLGSGLATINLPAGYRYLDSTEARFILEELWENRKGQKVLGMIVPGTKSAIEADYVFLLQYEAVGYVKDDDAETINYDDLLKELKADATRENEERRKEGMEDMNLIGWASRPFYDKSRHTLNWAKEYRVGNSEENTLNYDLRILGRKGFLSVMAVSGMSQLDSVKKNIDPVLSMITFDSGQRYADFDSNTDEVAAWTIGSLVAGKVLAKVGFFAMLLKYLKLIVLGVVALFAAIWRWVRGRKKEDESEEPAPDPQPVAAPESQG